MNILNRAVNYINGARQELKKVVWPSKKETTNHTILVIGVSIGVALFLGLVDYLLTFILGFIL